MFAGRRQAAQSIAEQLPQNAAFAFLCKCRDETHHFDKGDHFHWISELHFDRTYPADVAVFGADYFDMPMMVRVFLDWVDPGSATDPTVIHRRRVRLPSTSPAKRVFVPSWP